MSDRFDTVSKMTLSDWRVKGSKFFGFVFPIDSEETFKEVLIRIKSEHKKASHHCYAYRLFSPQLERSNDDGEPSGTAGKPILGQLIKFNLYNTGAIVVRYFGGTKLGVRGLIDAYQESCFLAIEQAEIKKEIQYAFIDIEADYSATAFIERFISMRSIKVVEERFENKIYKTIAVPSSEADSLRVLLEEEIKAQFGYHNLSEHPIKILS